VLDRRTLTRKGGVIESGAAAMAAASPSAAMGDVSRASTGRS